jgi:hypothetical protein
MSNRIREKSSSAKILQLDAAGFPRSWASIKEAIYALCSGKVLWQMGSLKTAFGGYNNEGIQSQIDIPAIIATAGNPRMTNFKHAALTNRNLFRRDEYTCQYCGNVHTKDNKLSRDHIIPVSKGGPDVWTNVVAACVKCNHFKADRTPEQAGMELIAVPFAPNIYEGFYLKQPTLVADQLDYLANKFTSERMIERTSLELTRDSLALA